VDPTCCHDAGWNCSRSRAAEEPLTLAAKIHLGRVMGRIHHLAFDIKRKRLFVAELGNNLVGVIDLAVHK